MEEPIVCTKCGCYNDLKDKACWKCKKPISEEDIQAAKNAVELREAKQREQLRIQANAKNMLVTTTPSIPNAEIESFYGIVSAEVVYGMNIFKDLFAGIRDIVGGRNKLTQSALKEGRETAINELKKEAAILGANAVLGVDLDYHELTGGSKGGMLMIVATGTAVKLRVHDETK
jgi:uncharacterized protein YbjQ (UPF0145 family)